MSDLDSKRTSPPGTRVNLVRVFTKKGLASRSQAREWILAGRVRVNGRVEKYLYAWVDLSADEIRLDDQPINEKPENLYLLFHKPAGFLTTRKDLENRPTIYDLLPVFSSWIFPAGRLDMDSEGLLFLSNDGPMCEWLIHPHSHVEKTYRALIDRELQERDRKRLQSGVAIQDYISKPARVRRLNGLWVEISIYEGKNRQVRRMFEAVGYEVKRLLRTRIGPMELGDLASAQWRPLSEAELAALRSLQAASPKSDL